MAIARILFPLPLPEPFDYAVPDGMTVEAGSYVRAPLGKLERTGVVWEVVDDPYGRGSNLKPVLEVYPTRPMGEDMRRFVRFAAKYTVTPPGHILGMSLRSRGGLQPSPTERVYRLTGEMPPKVTPARERVIAALTEMGEGLGSEIAAAAQVSAGVVKGLVEAGAIEAVERPVDLPFPVPTNLPRALDLTNEQTLAADDLRDAVAGGGFSPWLLDGVTGSGKTEVYFEAIAAALDRDDAPQILVLLPEIALTQAIWSRFEKRFGAAPAAWHSDVPAAARRRVWRRVLDGQVRLVVGARSALFLPFQNLQMIIVDEEHDPAYKQEDGVLYHGRDMAVARGNLDRIPIILASATPALETMVNALDDRYHRLTLTERFGAATLPVIDLIDLRETPPTPGQQPEGSPAAARQPSWIAPPLADAISETMVREEQALLFLNRRGYAPLTICRKCGHRMMAPDSDTCLVEHRFENRLICHHTGYSIPKPKACPQCNAVDSLAACGPGVERIADEVRRRWPHARTEILSSDRTQGAGTAKALLEAMRNSQIDILVATQAAAKGHNFPNLTLVGVIDADMGLSGGDLRAAERTYQLLAQVAGRAGRAAKPGRALIQTHQPNAPVLQALIDGDRDRFLAIEAEGRMAMLFPPFGRLAAIVLRGKNETQVRTTAQTLRQVAPRTQGIEIWGPAPAPLYRLNGEVRMRMLVRCRRDLNLQAYLRDWHGKTKIPSAIRRTIDIDPYSFM